MVVILAARLSIPMVLVGAAIEWLVGRGGEWDEGREGKERRAALEPEDEEVRSSGLAEMRSRRIGVVPVAGYRIKSRELYSIHIS